MRQVLLGSFAVIVTTGTLYAETFSADVWVDNWFALHANGVLVGEDSVPITTERSFNAESFTFEATLPLVLAVKLMDFKENDTGLEYIGSRRQQMGDGGAILQVMNADGSVMAVSDDGWKCLVVHEAPLNKACEAADNPVAGTAPCDFESTDEPVDWTQAGFDDSSWSAATVHTEAAIRPKDGYDRVNWTASAQLIWGPDLETANTVLCRVTVE
ncbi:MAG: PEBP family protein [Rhodobacteraceae bacterium]|nr:PEBP family protein [Paracoccaceae bacterium]